MIYLVYETTDTTTDGAKAWFPPEKLFQIPGLPTTFFTFSTTFYIRVPGLFQDFQRNPRTLRDFNGVVRIARTKFLFRKIKICIL